MKVSVCVPIYGVEKYIKQCVRSLMEQTMTDGIEFIFVNDCTKDKSMSILNQVLEEYPHRLDQVKIIEHEVNKGLPSARNTALNEAKGEYIVHCDSDDWVEPTMYESMYNKAKISNADIIGCGFYIENGNNSIPIIDNFNHSPIDGLKCLLVMRDMHFNVWQRLVKKSLYTDNCIVFDERFNLGEDCYACIRLHSVAQKLSTVRKPLYHYRTSNKNSLVHSSNKKGEKELSIMMDAVEKSLIKQGLLQELSLHFKSFCYMHKFWQTFFYSDDYDFSWYKSYRKELNKNVFKLILPISMKIMVLIGSIISFSVFKYLIIKYKLCLQTLHKRE